MAKDRDDTSGRNRPPGFEQAAKVVGLFVGADAAKAMLAACDRAMEKEGLRAGAAAMWTYLQKEQPSFLAEMGGLWRGGREDFINTLMGLNLTREQGAPGSPTSQLVTESLTDKNVDLQKDVIDLTPAPQPGQEQQQPEQGRGDDGRGRGGRGGR